MSKIVRIGWLCLILSFFSDDVFAASSRFQRLRGRLTHVVGMYFLYSYLKEWINHGSPVYKFVQEFVAKRKFDSLSQSSFLSPEMRKRCQVLFWLWKETASPEVKMLVTENLEILKTICCKNKSQIKQQVLLASLKLRLQRVQYEAVWPTEMKDFLLGQITKLMGKKNFVDQRQFCLISGNYNESLNSVILNKLSFLLGREPLIVDCKLLREDDISPTQSGNNLYSRPTIFTKLYLDRKPGINFILIKNLEALKNPRDIKAMQLFFQRKQSPYDPSIGDCLDFSRDFIATTASELSFVQASFKETLKVFDLGKYDPKEPFCKTLKSEFVEQQVTVRRATLSFAEKKTLLSFYQEHYSHKNLSKFLATFFAEFEQNEERFSDALSVLLNKKEVKQGVFSPNELSIKKLLKLNLQELRLPKDILALARKDQEELQQLVHSSASVFEVARHLKMLLSIARLEKGEGTAESSFRKVAQKLNASHFGLKQVKDYVLRFLAMKKATAENRGQILLLVGPPGVGKTSISQGIASALNKSFVSIACPTIINRAQLCGWPLSYKSAKEGLFTQALLQANVLDPVILIDEVDKLSIEGKTEVLTPLLQALDPQQNHHFADNYLETNIDLSKVFFILSANSLDGIPLPILDRCNVVTIPGYTFEEKLIIAQEYLLPKIISKLRPEFASLINISSEELNDFVVRDQESLGVRRLSELLENSVMGVLMDYFLTD